MSCSVAAWVSAYKERRIGTTGNWNEAEIESICLISTEGASSWENIICWYAETYVAYFQLAQCLLRLLWVKSCHGAFCCRGERT